MLKYTFSAITLLLALFVISCEDTTSTTLQPTNSSRFRSDNSEIVKEPNDNHRDEPVVEPELEPEPVVEPQPVVEPGPVVEPVDPNKQRLIEKLPLTVGMGIQVQNVNPKGLRVRADPNLNGKVKGHVWDGETGLITRETHPLLHDIDDRFTWWYVKWDNGKEGWSAQAGLNGVRYLVVEH